MSPGMFGPIFWCEIRSFNVAKSVAECVQNDELRWEKLGKSVMALVRRRTTQSKLVYVIDLARRLDQFDELVRTASDFGMLHLLDPLERCSLGTKAELLVSLGTLLLQVLLGWSLAVSLL